MDKTSQRGPRRRIGRVVVVSLLLAATASASGGCGGGLFAADLDRVSTDIDKVTRSIEGISSQWREELPKLVAQLEGLENRVAADAKGVVTDATNEVRDLARQTVQLTDAKAQDLVARAGAEFRCNAGFVKAGVVSELRHLADKVRSGTGTSRTPRTSRTPSAGSIPRCCRCTPPGTTGR